jgi:fluoroquinolone resistance protein
MIVISHRLSLLDASFLIVRCNLSLIKIPQSHFMESKLLGVDWTVAYWPSSHLDSELKFSRCILNDSSFFGLTLNELKLNQCKLHEVNLRGGYFSNSSMTYYDFTNSLFMHTNLQNVDFSQSSNFNINVLENKISKAKFPQYEALSLLSSLDTELVD